MRHILFDLDGTLIDSAQSILAGFARVLEIYKITPKCKLTNALIGPPLSDTLKIISGLNDGEPLQNLVNAFKFYYDEFGYKESQEYPGTTQALRSLYASQRELYIVTNKRRVPTQNILQLFKWTEFFRGVHSTDSFGSAPYSKSQMISSVLSLNEIDARDAIYVGDTLGDWKAANENGVRFLGVPWGYDSWGGYKPELISSLNDISSL